MDFHDTSPDSNLCRVMVLTILFLPWDDMQVACGSCGS